MWLYGDASLAGHVIAGPGFVVGDVERVRGDMHIHGSRRTLAIAMMLTMMVSISPGTSTSAAAQNGGWLPASLPTVSALPQQSGLDSPVQPRFYYAPYCSVGGTYAYYAQVYSPYAETYAYYSYIYYTTSPSVTYAYYSYAYNDLANYYAYYAYIYWYYRYYSTAATYSYYAYYYSYYGYYYANLKYQLSANTYADYARAYGSYARDYAYYAYLYMYYYCY
jgi:hypothetical protein